MANWRDRLTARGSFRGAGFVLDRSKLSTGRRNVKHQYPFKNKAFGEDTGQEARDFAIEVFVIGDEYLTARDALLTELEKEGPGELVHPLHGTLQVQIGPVTLEESTDEGGWAQFSISCFPTDEKPAQPSAVVDGKAAALGAVTAAKTSISAEFLAAFNELAARRDAVAGALRSAASAVDDVVSQVQMATQVVADLKRSVDDVVSSAESLAGSALDLLATQVDLIESLSAGIEASIATIADPVGALLALYEFDPGERPAATTPNAEIEQVNFDAVQRLTQRLVVAQAATLAVNVTYRTYEDATRTRDAVADLIDDQSEIAADDTYPALLALRSALVAAVPGAAEDLPRLLKYTPNVTVPSLLLAHQLYGSTDLEADLVARNRIKNPGFVPGGVELEVLSDAD